MHQIVYLILITTLFLLGLLLIYTYKRLGRGWSIGSIFKDFNRKIWMTFFLGMAFFSLYLCAVTLGAHFIRTWETDIFFQVYQHPVYFIYLGLSLFGCTSMAIYLIRMVIKYFYLTRGKDR